MDLLRRIFSQGNTKASQDRGSAEGVAANSANQHRGLDWSSEDPVEPLSAHGDGATRPLPAESVISYSNEHLWFGQTSDVGMVRTTNQDAAFSFVSTSRNSNQRPDFGLFIIADGMGGHHDGEKASMYTANLVASHITSRIFVPMLNVDEPNDRIQITEAMIDAVQRANNDVISKVPDGGTTLTAVVVVGDLAYVVHVGDSRVYLVSKDAIEQLTRDHSLVQRLIELDQLTKEEAQNHPQKNVLYRALGQSETLEVDAVIRRLPPNSRLVICSDGLWNMVSEREISEIALQSATPQEACDRLVALANQNGGSDNISAIILRVPTH